MPKNFKRKKLLYILGLALGIAFVSFFLIKYAPKKVEAGWYDDSYAYRALFTFTHNAEITAPRSITLTLDTAEIIAAGLMQTDCDDIRFTDGNGKVLPYDLTGTCNNASTTLEVIFPSVINGTNVGYVYYGNPSAPNKEIDSSVYTTLTPNGGDPSNTTPTTADEIGTGPILYWSMDEGNGTTIRDETGHGITGTLSTTSAWTASQTCVSGSCINTNTGSPYAKISKTYSASTDAMLLPGTESFTLSIWAQFYSGTYGPANIITRADAGWTIGYKLYFDASDHLCFDMAASPSYTSLCTTQTYNDSKWHHFTAVKTSASSITLYADGNQVATSTSVIGSSLDGTNLTLYLGVGVDGGDTEAWGDPLDEFKYFKYAMTSAQVKTEFAAKGLSKAVSTRFDSALNDLNSGLIAYYSLDAFSGTSAKDFSPNGTTGTLRNSPTWTSGKFGNGLKMTAASSQDVTFTPNIDFTRAFTLTAWIFPNDSTRLNPIIATYTGDCVEFALQADGSITYSHQVGSGVCNGDYASTTTNLITSSAWQHVTVTYDGASTYKIFLNGRDVTSDSSAFVGSGNQILAIGNATGTGDGYLDGNIDEVRIYQKALKPAEVEALYSWAPGPIGWWKFDENTGSTSNDASGNGNVATISDSAPLGNWTQGKFGGGFEMRGNNDDDNITIGSSMNLGKRNTISYWMYPTDTDATTDAVIGGFGTTSGYMSYIDFAGGIIYARQNVASGVNVAQTFSPKTWYHIEVVRDGTSVTFYVNGSKIGNTQTLSADTDFYIVTLVNYITGSLAFPFNGILDDIRIYNYSRTPRQVLEDMNGGHPIGGSPIASQVIYYDMDESISTLLHNQNAAQSAITSTISGASWKVGSPCKINSCLDFDGSNDVSTTTNADPIDLNVGLANGFTITAWINPDAAGEGTGGQIFYKGTNTWLRADTLSSGMLDLEGSLDLATSDATLNVSAAVSVGAWNHIAMTWTDDTDDEISLWVNGRLVGTSTNGSGAPAADTGNLLIGGNTTNNFDGRIDELKVYSVELRSSDILVDLNANSNTALGGVGNSSQNNEGVIGTGPLAYFKFDEKSGINTYDYSGNLYVGSFQSDATWANGKLQSGVNFDGADDFVATTLNVDLSGPFTFSFWTYPRVVAEDDTLISTTLPFFTLSFGVSSSLVVCTDEFCVNPAESNASIITANKWSHIVVTYDGVPNTNGSLNIYVNGVNQTLDGNVSGENYAGHSLVFGTFYGGLGLFSMDGIMDEVKVYNYELSQTQVAYEFNRGAPIAQYDADECSGTTTHDVAPKANPTDSALNGTLTLGAGGVTSAGDCTTNASTSWYNGRTGKYGSALSLDATDDYLSVGSSAIFDDMPAMTISMWVKPTSTTFGGMLAAKAATTTGLSGGWAFYTLSTNVLSFGADYTTDATRTSANNTLTIGSWQHIAVTWDFTTSSNIHIYKNGNEVTYSATGSDTPGTRVSDAARNLEFGVNPQHSAERYNGLMDDIRIYNYPLSATQIKTVYNEASAQRFGP